MNRLMYFILLSLFNIITSNITIAQVRIDGIVVDSITLKPVSYASVGLYKTTKGSISNENGVFILYADSFPVTIVVNVIGYNQTKYLVQDNFKQVVIRIKPLVYNFAEAVVKANEADLIFKKAVDNLNTQTPYIYKANSFFRLLTQNDSLHTEMIEAFHNTWIGKSGIIYWDMQHGRYAVAENAREMQYATSLDFSVISRYASILNIRQIDYINYLPFVFDKRYNKMLWFSIKEHFVSDSNEIVRIDFYPKKKYKKKIATWGSVYVDVANGHVYRLVQHFDKWENPLIKPTDKSFYIGNLKAAFDFRFQKSEEKTMLLAFLKVDMEYDLFESKSEKLLHHINTKSDLLIYDYEKTKISEISDSLEYETDYRAILHRLYLQQFWDENQILAEVPIEEKVRKDFEKTGAFHHSFQNSRDTSLILGDKYILWNQNRQLNMSSLSSTKSPYYFKDKLRILYEGEPLGEIYGELYFSWNCYKDSFYFILLPMINIQESWIYSSEIGNSSTEFIYQSYIDLLEIYKRKLQLKLAEIKSPCASVISTKLIY